MARYCYAIGYLSGQLRRLEVLLRRSRHPRTRGYTSSVPRHGASWCRLPQTSDEARVPTVRRAFSKTPSSLARTIATDGLRSNDGGRSPPGDARVRCAIDCESQRRSTSEISAPPSAAADPALARAPWRQASSDAEALPSGRATWHPARPPAFALTG